MPGPGRGPGRAGRASLLSQDEPALPACLARHESPQSSTHMGEGEFAERCLIALLLHLLHQRADHQLRIQAWNQAELSQTGTRGNPVPFLCPRPALPPEMRAVPLCTTARTSWV